jgi:uncharacterized membrane protein
VDHERFLHRYFDFARTRVAIAWLVVVAAPILVWTCIANGPFQGSDEVEHFFRAVQMSQGRFFPVKAPDRPAAGDYLDAQLVKLGGYFEHVGRKRPNQAFASGPEDYRTAWAEPLTGHARFADFSNTVIYFPLAHAVPALSTAVLRSAGAPPMAWLYASRLVDAALALLLFAFVIAVLPEARWLVFATALLPRVVFASASVSADALLVPCCALFAALLYRLSRDRELSRGHQAVLLIATLFICTAKLAYLPLAVLPPLVGWLTRASFARNVRPLLVGCGAIVAIWLVWTMSVRHYVFPILHDVPIDVYGQLTHVLADPFRFARVMAMTIMQSGLSYGSQLVAGDIGGAGIRGPWVNFPLPMAMVTLLVLVALAFAGSEPVRAKPAQLLAVTLVTMGDVIVIFLLLYMQFTELDADRVNGVQGRYFLPFVILVGAFLPKIQIAPRYRPVLGLIAVAWFACTSVEMSYLLKKRYWDVEQAPDIRLRGSNYVNLS